jgi:hypothetical protein
MFFGKFGLFEEKVVPLQTKLPVFAKFGLKK